MSKDYANVVSSNASHHQMEKAKKGQVKNNAGGYVFKTDRWTYLNRFLILGSEAPTYYVSSKKLTKDNAKNILKLIKKDGKKVVDMAVDISVSGRAYKNDPVLFVIALCASSDNVETRRYALENLHKVARIGTHLFTFVTYVDQMRGWGKLLKESITNWYESKDVEKLAFQVCKYASRRVEGELPWSHRDLLRKVHIKPKDLEYNLIYKYVTKGREGFTNEEWDGLKNGKLKYIWAHEEAKKPQYSLNSNINNLVSLIKDYSLVHESIPTEAKSNAEVYKALLPHMPMTATIRSLSTMSKLGILKPLSEESYMVANRIDNKENLKNAKVHPISILAAYKTYFSGKGFKGSQSWDVNQDIVNALDSAFYKSFENVEPTGKKMLVGIDVSGSMGVFNCAGLNSLTAREGAAAIAMSIVRTEEKVYTMAFSSKLVKFPITKSDSLDSVVKKSSNIPMGMTDCDLPMVHALENKLDVDVFIILTDNETYYGNIHPYEALNQYRKKFNKNAKLIVLAMESTRLSIADKDDPGMLDICGLDSNALKLIHEFSTDNI